MKIKYEFANETVEIEVSEEWASVLIDLDRQEYNNDHAETRRHCSLDALNLDDAYLPSKEDTFEEMLRRADAQHLRSVIEKLKPAHRDLIMALFFEGVSNEEYARRCGVAPPAITQRKATALKKLKKFLEKP